MSEKKTMSETIPEILIEFSRPVDVTTIPAKGRHYKYEASSEEMAALAQRYGVLSLAGLKAECGLTPGKKGDFKLDASFSASITQACSISLEPVSEDVSGEFSVIYRQPPRRPRAQDSEIIFDAEEEDFEFLTSLEVDLGEVIAQHLSLEINPYPRKPEVTGEELGYKIVREEDYVAEDEKQNPFDVLKSLKHKT